MNFGLSKLRLFFILAGLALLGVLLNPLSANGQGVSGYVKLNSFERKVAPEKVFKGEKFQGLLKADATLVKELPLNTDIEVEYEVRAKLDANQPGEIVGKGVLKMGPLPSVKPGANVNLNETMELIFPDSARPGPYTLIIEATSIKPFMIGMIADLIFPGLKSFSMTLGKVEYLGEKPISTPPTTQPTATPVAPVKAADIDIAVHAPQKAIATLPVDVEIAIRMPNIEKVTLALYSQKGAEAKAFIREITLAGDSRVKESISTPDYDGNIRVVAEVKSYVVAGKQITPEAPLFKSADVTLKRRPLQAAGKVDEAGIVRRAFQVVSPDSKAIVDMPVGVKALTADGQPVSEIVVQLELVPPIGQGPSASSSRQVGKVIGGKAYKMLPDGAVFEPPLKVAIKYEKSELPRNIKESQLAIAYFSEASGWVKLPSDVDREKQVVMGGVGHFSLLAIVGEASGANYWLIGVIGSVAAAALFWGWRTLGRHKAIRTN